MGFLLWLNTHELITCSIGFFLNTSNSYNLFVRFHKTLYIVCWWAINFTQGLRNHSLYDVPTLLPFSIPASFRSVLHLLMRSFLNFFHPPSLSPHFLLSPFFSDRFLPPSIHPPIHPPIHHLRTPSIHPIQLLVLPFLLPSPPPFPPFVLPLSLSFPSSLHVYLLT